MRIGYACDWKKPRIRTWSHIALSLCNALSETKDIECIDIDVSLSRFQVYSYALLSTRMINGTLKSKFQHSPTYRRQLERKFQKEVDKRSALDAIIEIGDIGVAPDVPSYLYQDFSIDQLIQYYHMHGHPRPMFEVFTMDDLQRRRELQQRLYEQCAGVFCMSRSFAESLVNLTGLERSKVHLVHAGVHVKPTIQPVLSFQKKGQPLMLFVGRDFFRKAGDLVVEAFTLLRREQLPDAKLAVAGPKKWPLQGPIPDGVMFLGDAPWSVLQEYYATADLFCMPSRDEGFGIVYAEALCHGIPCIGRKTETISEIIQDGINGYLLETDDALKLGELMLKALNNKGMREKLWDLASTYQQYYSWKRVTKDMVDIIRKDKNS